MRLLILGGTTEASALAAALAGRADVAAVLSLAGRTGDPAPSPIPRRIGGFGGAAGLRDYLKAERIDAVVDATHPFAARMSRHATEACKATGVARLVFTRAPWARVKTCTRKPSPCTPQSHSATCARRTGGWRRPPRRSVRP